MTWFYRILKHDLELSQDHDPETTVSVPLQELADALKPFLGISQIPRNVCPDCGGRCVEDLHETGDGAGGPCSTCRGKGVV